MANAFIMDWMMLWKELLAGFLIAGFVYAKYYGTRAAVYITIIFFIAAVVAGLIADLLFSVLGLIPTGPRPPSAVQHAMISWNYTSWLDIVALLIGGWLLYLFLAQPKQKGH